MRIEPVLASLLLLFGNCHAAAPAGSADVSLLVEETGLSAGAPLIDIAVTTASDLCYAGRFESDSGLTLLTTKEDNPPRFHAASISKLFTATVIMQLRDEEKLSLNDRVGKFIPAFRGHEIRLEHLLTHTSGLRDRERAKGRKSREEVDAYINALARQHISKSPGMNWHYADAGFNLLGRVIENITDESFSDVLRGRLLLPLGMTSSSFEISGLPEDSLVGGFDKRGRLLQHPWDRAFLPSSGLQTNARDLAKFARAVLQVNTGQEVHGFLPVETLREMTDVRIPTSWNGVDQAYAWQISKSESEPVQEDWPRFQLVGQIKDTVTSASTTVCRLESESKIIGSP